ncbi:MAG TPA: hypothetical protein EYH45_07235 [Candidatus Caldiarchaeum subterraneum]|uniref:Uncharacterized protein n=1 Tax=Caldiarchaeum subterraneum TaxID=311458 RepID=A0A832ZWV8_CALS0|nr:hypothetical protein [Candidatus Caldarchaeum subterraneum]
MRIAGATLQLAVLVLLLLGSALHASAQEAGFEVISRRVEVYATGVVYVIDSFIPSSSTAVIEESLSEDMAANLVAAYVIGAEAEVNVVNNIDSGKAIVRVTPVEGWRVGSKISLVKVMKNFLVETGTPNTYRLFILPAPRLGSVIENMEFELVAPPNTEIRSDIKGLEITSYPEKTVASLKLNNINPATADPYIFTLTIPRQEFEIILDRVNTEIFVEDAEIGMFVRVVNVVARTLGRVSFVIPSGAEVISVSDGIRNLGFNVEENNLVVTLPYEITTGERIGLFIRMRAESVVERVDGAIIVYPPALLNATVREYVVEVISPPGDYKGSEPPATSVKREFGPRTVLSYTFRETVITPNTSIRLEGRSVFSLASVTPYLWIGAIIFSIVAVTAGKKVAGKRRTAAPENALNTLSTVVSSLQDAIKECEALLNLLNPRQKTIPQPKTTLESRVNNIAKSLRISPEVKKQASRISREAEQSISRIENEAQEISSTLRALTRNYEDFRSGRISQRVYEKIYLTYEKAVSSSLADIREYLYVLRAELKR